MNYLDALKPFFSEGQALLDKQRDLDIEFSAETYQIEVFDPEEKKAFWTFLQVNKDAEIRDAFCSCEISEDKGGCVHLAAAYLYIMGGHDEPLHIRFEHSLWHFLCRLYCDLYGDDPGILEKGKKGEYFLKPINGNELFVVRGLNAEAKTTIENLIRYRKEQTEETSLKFSNLTSEEITAWKHGNPSLDLRYELSFWSDIAKLLLLKQERGTPYSISFLSDNDGVPNNIHIHFDGLFLSFFLSRFELSEMVPALATVDSPLRVFFTERKDDEKIIYDKKSNRFYYAEKKIAKGPEDSIVIDNWRFVPGKGFYARDKLHALLMGQVSDSQLSHFLDEHHLELARRLSNEKIESNPVSVQYALDFDTGWNLRIAAYLFRPGDLLEGNSHYFGSWCYLDGRGFYSIKDLHFSKILTVIAEKDVHDFVSKQRTWLNTIPGFEIHLKAIETKVTYSLTDDKRLFFHREIGVDENDQEMKDFGPWIYLAGEGFFSKVNTQVSLPIKPGTSIPSEQVASFIRENREELLLIKEFFNHKCPIDHMGITLTIEEPETLFVNPTYTLLKEYQDENLFFFDEFVFVTGKGFSELPLNKRLPSKIKDPLILKKEKALHFIIEELPDYEHLVISCDSRVFPPKNLSLVTEKIQYSKKFGDGFYDLQLSYTSEKGAVSLAEVWYALRNKQKLYFTNAGVLDLTSRRFDWIRKLEKKRLDRRSNLFSVTAWELLRLHVVESFSLRKSRRKDYQQSKKLLDELLEGKVEQLADLSLLKSRLRPYQEKGLQWLWFLYSHQMSGFLCDEMGLGKTHQAMALISAIKMANRHQSIHFLVICPTSVIYHWQEKLQAFLPSLRVCTFHGSNPSLKDFKEDYDILLTSYGIWRNEVDLLKQVPFELAILDEIQIAKNTSSRVHQALRHIDVKMRVGLTGTPIENQLLELKALFDIILPSFMPSDKKFKDLFVKPIEKEGSTKHRQLLSSLINPFMLRRKKAEVLRDLPPKIEEVAHCELLPEQLNLYNDILRQSRTRLLSELQSENQSIPYIHIFALLSHLKQICNHPAVYFKEPANYRLYRSGKWNLFTELLSEARDSDQKVVVFSQYLNMLDIMELYLYERGISFASVRGSTLNRGEEIKKFNEDPGCAVFLGSLQAVGLGVDLTAASVVIHYDRWWNAARENQATDRVHRIGQKRGVQVFKLVTKDTFEERIDQLILAKGKLMEEVVTADDDRVVKQFDRHELIELLQYVPGFQH